MKRRFIVSAKGSGVYHCMNRTIHGMRLLGEREKEVFLKIMRAAADFSGLEIYTYALMNNHFHIVVKVPERPDEIPDEILLKRYRRLYPHPTPSNPVSGDELGEILARNDTVANLWRKRLLRRMYDLSEFIKTLKQRFTIWYNATHERFGTFWADRFKSVVIDPDGYALQMVTAYVDLNPVRAGMVDDPGDYMYTGYGAAMAGDAVARDALTRMMRGFAKTRLDCFAAYRVILFGRGSRPDKQKGTAAANISEERSRAVLQADGALTEAELLRSRIAFFERGIAIGSDCFLKKVSALLRELRNLKKQPEPKPVGGCTKWSGIGSLRGVHKAAFGP